MQFGPLDHDCQTYTSAVTLRITLPYNAGIAMGTRKQREKQENLVGGAHGAGIGAGASVLPAAQQLSHVDWPLLVASPMRLFVAFRAQGDQVLFLVGTRLAAEFEVMHLQILHATAELAPPAVALQHLAMQVSIARRIESQSRVLGWDLLHEACPATSDRNASC